MNSDGMRGREEETAIQFALKCLLEESRHATAARRMYRELFKEACYRLHDNVSRLPLALQACSRNLLQVF